MIEPQNNIRIVPSLLDLYLVMIFFVYFFNTMFGLERIGGSLKKKYCHIVLFIVRRQNLKKSKNQVTTYVSVITHHLSLLIVMY
jgi:hypothetical protein